ncbi:AraC family transcriptional regulator [Gluconacetobacter sacchari]|uniref:Helix-turn-helix transcriptional regulator n=2 Tax=Gluconacetobacter sacchari TaxID=92759 RepID=A0A7W4IDC2_9PROT|nr:helix-turn-helix transcriptional regulator [Gluconacetobacter sacchari]MBB2160745.1 helix-turn-helix transcriptional regulator [Gluconacetobacter sacchari]GBQ29148.1 AraC family transcriptional regulator [Gluconacetobacter sacchari DSM 12717]
MSTQAKILPIKRSSDLPHDASPVVGLADHYPPGFSDPFHAHERCQLALTVSGVITVTTDAASYILPPNRAIWIPAGTHHQVTTRAAVQFRTLYVDNTLNKWPDRCHVFETTPLVRALIDEVLQFRFPFPPHGREVRLTSLLLDELDRMPSVGLRISMPSDRRLARVCRALLLDPTDGRDLDHWAIEAGMGRRTFTRLFREQTGMGLASWRQQARMVEAIALLEQGRSVTVAAYDVGYDSPSAFSAAFHRIFGMSPSAYCRGSAKI